MTGVDVLDASAVLAFLNDEPGADAVGNIIHGAYLHPVNLAEVLTVIGRKDPTAAPDVVATLEAIGVRLSGHAFEVEDSMEAAQLSAQDRALSLGDRCCLAFATSLGSARVHTTDSAWSRLKLGVTVQQIR